MTSDQVVQMGPMLVLAGLSAGWLVETSIVRRGYGLIVDLGVGVGTSLVGGMALLAFSGLPGGMLPMFGVGFVMATSVILIQRLGWPCQPGARERRTRRRLVAMASPSLGVEGAAAGSLHRDDARARHPVPTPALARLATTGIYLLRGVPIEIQRAARGRATREGTTLRQVLLTGVGEYAAGTWTPRPDDTRPVALNPVVRATDR